MENRSKASQKRKKTTKSIRTSGFTSTVTDVVERLAAAVKARRKSLGLNQKTLSELAQCGVVFIYDVERAKPTLRIDKLISVLDVLGLEVMVQNRQINLTKANK